MVLEHQNIRGIIVVMRGDSAGSELKLKRLTLIMPSLVHVEFVDSIERVRVVASSEKVVVKYTRLTSVGRY